MNEHDHGHGHGHGHDQDHHDHHAHMAADFRKRFWISLALTLPILVLSPLLLQELAGLREAILKKGDLS
jgi:Cu2+-exporting ATPase